MKNYQKKIYGKAEQMKQLSYKSKENSISSKNSNAKQQVEIRTPKIDMFENPETYLVRICIPGVQKDDVQIYFSEEDTLEIKGVVKPLVQAQFDKPTIQEIFQGPFQRSVYFLEEISQDNAYFQYNHGILEVYVPKR